MIDESNQTTHQQFQESLSTAYNTFRERLDKVYQELPENVKLRHTNTVWELDAMFDDALDKIKFLRMAIDGKPRDYDLDAWLAFAAEKANMQTVLTAVLANHNEQGQMLDLMASKMFEMDSCGDEFASIDWGVIRSEVFKHFSKDDGDIVDRVLELVKVMFSESVEGCGDVKGVIFSVFFGVVLGLLASLVVKKLDNIEKPPELEDPNAKFIMPVDGVHCLVLQTSTDIAVSCWNVEKIHQLEQMRPFGA